MWGSVLGLIRSGVMSFLLPLLLDWSKREGRLLLAEARAAAEEFVRQALTPDGWTDQEAEAFIRERLEAAAADGLAWDEELVNRALRIAVRWARANGRQVWKRLGRAIPAGGLDGLFR